MKSFSALILSAILTIAMSSAHAGVADIVFTAATKNTDGGNLPTNCPTAAPCGKLASTVIEYGTCAGTVAAPTWGVKEGERIVLMPGLTTTIPIAAIQTYCFRAKHVDDYGMSSAWTGVATKVNVAPLPNPPGSLSVAANTAYYIIQQENKYVALPVGTVPAGTLCDTTQVVLGYYVVPRTAVQWYGNTKPQAVVAQCG